MQNFCRYYLHFAAFMRLLILIFLVAFASCNSKEYSLEKLAASKWEELEPGVDYIKTRNGKITTKDSVVFIFKGVSTSGLLVSSETVSPEKREGLSALSGDMMTTFKEKIPGTEGYLRIDIGRFVFFKNPKITVYLTGTLDSTTTANYHNRLLRFPGVEKVEYVSKEMAKKKFMGDNLGEDWEKILVDNPLPPSFDLTISKGYFDEEKLKALKDSIQSNLIYVDDVQYPRSLSQKDPILYFLQYKLH